jgi:hypothetical protein
MHRSAIAIALGIAITVALCIVFLPTWDNYPLNIPAKVLLWPITAFMQLAGAGPRIGPPEKNMHEGTPIHVLAFILGLGFSCIFYSALSFVILRWRTNRRAAT